MNVNHDRIYNCKISNISAIWFERTNSIASQSLDRHSQILKLEYRVDMQVSYTFTVIVFRLNYRCPRVACIFTSNNTKFFQTHRLHEPRLDNRIEDTSVTIVVNHHRLKAGSTGVDLERKRKLSTMNQRLGILLSPFFAFISS